MNIDLLICSFVLIGGVTGYNIPRYIAKAWHFRFCLTRVMET